MMLEQVRSFLVPVGIADATLDQLREAGNEGYERFVLWTGNIEGSSFETATMHVPDQTAYRTPDGLLVRVDGEALHSLNVWLYERSQILAVQVHAHPEEAYHSSTDDRYPIVSLAGSLSIVVPDFARRHTLLERARGYRLHERGWRRISRLENLVRIIDGSP